MAEREGKLVESLSSQVLDFPPSCVEFCPAFPSYFLVGTYSLQAQNENDGPEDANAREENDGVPRTKQPQSRNGSIIAFRVSDQTVTHVQTVPQPSALLDLRFNPHHGSRDVCAAVSSTATLALFRFSPDKPEPLQHLNTMDITAMSGGSITPSPGEEILFLSFGWHPTRPDLMAITTSTGHVYLVHLRTLDGGWELKPERIITHTLETWCVAISPGLAAPELPTGHQQGGDVPFRVYSGGDDSTLRHTTCTLNGEDLAASLSAVDSRGHDAGVTAILPLLGEEDGSELVVTGSYDEHIRLFTVPSLGRPRKLAESRLGGGVWRLKLIDLDRQPNGDGTWRARILASCMHAGVRVVELVRTAGDDYEFRVLGRFEEHKSMNYGSDFQFIREDTLRIISTSFYDKLLCMWQLEMI